MAYEEKANIILASAFTAVSNYAYYIVSKRRNLVLVRNAFLAFKGIMFNRLCR